MRESNQLMMRQWHVFKQLNQIPAGVTISKWANLEHLGHSVAATATPTLQMYRDEIYSLQNLLSRNQAGPGRTDKKEQEVILIKDY